MKLSQALRTRKLILMLAGFSCSAIFWMILVQYTLPRSKSATIELTVMRQESKMTKVEKMMYFNKLKNRERKRNLASKTSL
jgi:type II secretory pathway component PulM